MYAGEMIDRNNRRGGTMREQGRIRCAITEWEEEKQSKVRPPSHVLTTPGGSEDKIAHAVICVKYGGGKWKWEQGGGRQTDGAGTGITV